MTKQLRRRRKALVAKAQVEIPQSMVEHEKQHLIEDFSNRLMYQNKTDRAVSGKD